MPAAWQFCGMTRIAHEIFRGDWFITKSFAQSYLPAIVGIIKGNTPPHSTRTKDDAAPALQSAQITDRAAAFTFDPYYEGAGASKLPAGSTAVVPITGAIMKYDYCGEAGTKSIVNTLRRLDALSNIQAIVLRIDSGGGTVSGTMELSDAIKAVEKPIYAYIDDLAASAAYWIAASCDEIWANNAQAEIGSIGVYTTIADWNAYYESEGLPIKDIYSSLSTEKNGEYREALAGNDEPMRARLDILAGSFIDHVRNRRRIDTTAADPFKGAMYFAQEALSIGLIDAIGTEMDLLGSIATGSNNQNTNTPDMKIQNFPTLSKFRKGAELNAEAITGINAELAEENVAGFIVQATEDVPDLAAFEALVEAATTAQDDLVSTESALATITKIADASDDMLVAIRTAMGAEEGADLALIASQMADKAKKYDLKVAGTGAEGTGTSAVDNAGGGVNTEEFAHNKAAVAAGF